jgi:hypothetical protein
MMSRRATLLLVVAVATGCASLAAALAVVFADRSARPTFELELGVPTETSVAELRSFASSRSGALYWAGPRSNERLELTETKSGTFVRYLPGDADVGDRRSRYLTVATYAMPRAFAVASEAARRPGAIERELPGGGIAVWRTERPTSVYLAQVGSDRLVEVFDPDPLRARNLVMSGRVRPVPSG